MWVVVVGAIYAVRGWNIYCFDMLGGEGGKEVKTWGYNRGVYCLKGQREALLPFHLLLQLTASGAVERVRLVSNYFGTVEECAEVSKGRDRTISKRPDGPWENKRNDRDRPSSLHETQQEAILAARAMLLNQGGGELTTKGVDGKIRGKDTIAPGNDPNPPRDTEN